MKPDKSKILYDKLDVVQNKKVKLHLKNEKIKIGIIIGFFHSDSECVVRWIFQETEDESDEALLYNTEESEIINHKDILEVFFFDDNSQIIF